MKGKVSVLVSMALLLVVVSIAAPGAIRKVGQLDDKWFKSYVGMIGFKGALYAIEVESGTLNAIDPKTANKKQIGFLKFTKQAGMDTFFFYQYDVVGDNICMIAGNRGMFCVNPANGKYNQVGKDWDWQKTVIFTGLNGKIYSVEKDGTLYVTDPGAGDSKKISGNDFSETAGMFSVNGKLFIVSKDGQLTQVNPEDGKGAKIGKPDDWTSFEGGFDIGGKLFMIRKGDAQDQFEYVLYAVNSDTGERKKLGKFIPKLEGNKDLNSFAAAGDKIYALDDSHNTLWEISVK